MKYTAAVITISDLGAKGERVDTSGPALCEMLKEAGYEVVYTCIIPDEREMIERELVQCSDERKISLILTTGGTGFSPRDITPEATLAVIEREARGIPEAMRLASLKITPKGCLSRSVAGIRGGSLIVNLPGSKKASTENLEAVLGAIDHGLEMLASGGSANCGGVEEPAKKKEVPSMDEWIREAKREAHAENVGMYLFHNGTVRKTSKKMVREGVKDAAAVTGMMFSYDREKVEQAIATTKEMEGIYTVRVWLNEGELKVGEDLMYVLVGGDIRPHVMEALDYLVDRIKTECVSEIELNT
jgi:molybdenum cofactor synthesis domain-containing protein